MNKLAAVVQEWLDANGETANSLAVKTGLPRSTVYNLLRPEPPKAPPRETTMAALIKVIGWERRLREAAMQPLEGEKPVEGSPLQLLVGSRIRELGWSYQQVADATGGRLSKGAIGFIVSGKSTDLRDDSVDALSEALGLSRDALREAIAQSIAGVKYQLPPRVNRLSHEGWQSLVKHLDYLLELESRYGN